MDRALLRLGAATTLLLASLCLVTAVASPASANLSPGLVTGDPLQVYGDFVMTGNTVLGCPTAEPDHSRCLGASRRQNSLNNNSFAMTYADVDGVADTYDSSSGSVTVPEGAHVAYARLSWGGNLGGAPCGVGAAGTYPSGSASTQRVRLDVAGQGAHEVAPTTYGADTTADAGGTLRYYYASADVTADLAGVATGRPVAVTVGNVFAPEGKGCHGGWSLTVVHTLDHAPCGAERREVFVYDGHVRQGSSAPPTDVSISGFRVSGSPARVGVTAYEGDNGTGGDQFLINGQAMADPATGSTTNFFDSAADGALDPAYPNNFSVDAKKLTVPDGVIPSGSTSATLSTVTSGDTFGLQGLVLSVPVPSLCLTKTVSPRVAQPGDPLTWTITVRNPTTSDALAVAVTDPAVSSCERTLGTLTAGTATTYTCTSRAPEESLTNVATAEGRATGGNLLSATAAADVEVVHPAVVVDVTPSATDVPASDPVRFDVVVDNTGDAVLRDVTVEDPQVPGCQAQGLTVGAGATASVTCTAHPRHTFTQVVTVTGTVLDGSTVVTTVRAVHRVRITVRGTTASAVTTLPDTGVPAGLPWLGVAGLALVAGGLALARRFRAA